VTLEEELFKRAQLEAEADRILSIGIAHNRKVQRNAKRLKHWTGGRLTTAEINQMTAEMRARAGDGKVLG